MNMAAAYEMLTVPQLKQMLGAAHASHRRETEEIKAKWSFEVAALREAMAKSSAEATAELQMQKNANAALRRELDTVYVELEKVNTVIVEQERKLAAHNAVAELEQKLHVARRAVS